MLDSIAQRDGTVRAADTIAVQPNPDHAVNGLFSPVPNLRFPLTSSYSDLIETFIITHFTEMDLAMPVTVSVLVRSPNIVSFTESSQGCVQEVKIDL